MRHTFCETDIDIVAAHNTYVSAWKSQLSTTKSSSIIQAAAKSFHQRIVTHSDPKDVTHSIIYALVPFFTEFPPAIDFGLTIFGKFLDCLSENIAHDYGKGPEGARNLLKWFLYENSSFFQGMDGQLGRETSNDITSLDSSNIIFQPAEVSESRLAVLKQLEDFQKARTEAIVLFVMMGRCHAMNLAQVSHGKFKGDQISGWVDLLLERQYKGVPRWGKVDFVACCAMLRSCAKSLIQSLPDDVRDEKVKEWIEGYSRFLYGGEGGKNVDEDFAVKAHAMKVLNNLERGPFDESSAQLFDPAGWIF